MGCYECFFLVYGTSCHFVLKKDTIFVSFFSKRQAWITYRSMFFSNKKAPDVRCLILFIHFFAFLFFFFYCLIQFFYRHFLYFLRNATIIISIHITISSMLYHNPGQIVQDTFHTPQQYHTFGYLAIYFSVIRH